MTAVRCQEGLLPPPLWAQAVRVLQSQLTSAEAVQSVQTAMAQLTPEAQASVQRALR
jgi:hypothetical protein